MSVHIERALETLFPPDGPGVANVKFFRGTSRDVSREQYAEQLLRATEQIQSGEARLVENIDRASA